MTLIEEPARHDEDDIALSKKFGEAYQTPPWLIPGSLSIPQWYAFYHQEIPQTDEDKLALANRIRAKKGLPPLQGI